MPKSSTQSGYCQGILTSGALGRMAPLAASCCRSCTAPATKRELLCGGPRHTLSGMQLVQIGEVRQKTILDLVMEMAARQLAEIEQLKTVAQSRSRSTRSRRAGGRC